MAQRLSLKLKNEFEAYILFMQKRCSEMGSSGEFENCDMCGHIKECQATNDKLINYFAESIK